MSIVSRASRVAMVLLVSACGATGPAPERPPAIPERPAVPLPALSEGACGGFTEVALGGGMPLLGDRVRVPAIEGAEETGGGTAYRLRTGSMSWFTQARGGHRFAARATEVQRTAPPDLDLAAAVRTSQEGAETVVPRGAVDGSEHALVFLPPRDEREAEDGEEDEVEEEEAEEDPNELVPLVDAYVRTRDHSLVLVRYFASRSAYEEGGCERVAVRLAENTTAGERGLDMQAGERHLGYGISATLPANTVVERRDMGHWVEIYVHPISPLSIERTPFMMVRLDSHPGRPDVAVPISTSTAPVFGTTAEWRSWVADGGFHWRDVIVPGGPAGNVWVAIGAPTEEMIARLGAIAASLGERAVPDAPTPCEQVAAPGPAPRLELEGSGMSAHRALLEARELDTSASVFGRARPASLDALRALFALPAHQSVAAFRDLAHRGSPAGRVYGLAGLRVYLSPSVYESVACATRAALDTPIPVADDCGVRPVTGLELFESSDPSAANERGDLRRGQLASRLFTQALEGEPSLLFGEGWAPPIVEGVAPPRALSAGDPQAARPIVWNDGRFYWVTRDGRLARTVETDAGVSARFVDELVRYPADLAVGQGHCALDRDGRRACAGEAVFAAFNERHHTCGAPMPS